MFDFSNPETFWLNITNISLGLVTLVGIVVIFVSFYYELMDRRHAHRHAH
jgi:hypothetical protein